MMRAVWWIRPGPPEVLVPGEAPEPVPGPGQVLIRVEVAGVTFVETMIRAGRSPGPALAPPAILGNGVGGVVVAAGDGASRHTGQRVVSSTGGSGGYAELAVAAAGDLIPVPPGLDTRDAVALLADGRTATGLIRLAAPRPGQTVLVEAAGGGVGSLLVQLAAGAGARVIAAASTAAKRELALSLGAAAAVDYTVPGWAAALHDLAPDGLDIAFDGVGAGIGRTALEAMAPGGRFVVHGLAAGEATDTTGAAGRGVEVIGMDGFGTLGVSHRDLAAAALDEAAAGRLRPVVGQTFPLADAGGAHALMEARRARGKTLLLAGREAASD